ncbi:Dor1-like family-domain-containing protein [Scheffersomyces coipomensis]|uniref:Dor1-like family-domain-containing protein n=1 Tax=Scheffersomyces coipomensis TaxID=1788519 RepID=UPI00315C6700
MSDILLETLKQGLDPELVKFLESDPQLRLGSELYLQELLINDDLLSTEVFTTTSTNTAMTPSISTLSAESNGGNKKKITLTEEIAELDRQQREINVKLASITNENRELIIDISNDLHNINDKIDSDYNKEIDAMLKVLDIQTSNTNVNKFQININEKLTNAIKINNSILSNIDSVLDLLELPTLCKLCILQGNYQESLEISMLTQALIIRFPKLVIFQKIQNQVEQELRMMVKGLIKLLNTNLKQNNILKIFQILNKLDIINSTQSTSSSSSISSSNLTFSTKSNNSINKQQQKDKLLKIIFLNARYKFITDEISNLKPLIKFNKLTYLKRFIEVYREFIFNSLSMYYAIFNSSSSSSSSSHTATSLSPSVSQSSITGTSSSSTHSNTNSEEDNLLINQFIRSLANQLSQSLITYLPDILHSHSENEYDTEIDAQGQKDGLILQIIYLCKSLSKFNADFESIIRWDLCYVDDPLITENDWVRNLAKVKQFRY